MSQFYIGVKQVFAYPQERDGRPGYAVVYDYQTPKQFGSWSPKDVFEAAYLPMGEANDGSRVTQEMVDEFTRIDDVRTVDGKMTVATVRLLNGTLYVESSACVDPKNYDEKIGSEILLQRAKANVWHLLGFALQWARNGLK